MIPIFQFQIILFVPFISAVNPDSYRDAFNINEGIVFDESGGFDKLSLTGFPVP